MSNYLPDDEQQAISSLLRGQKLLELSRPKEARKAFFEALKLFPEMVPAWQGVAWCCINEKKFQEALTFAQKAHELAPEEPNNLYLLAVVSMMLDDIEEAMLWAEKAVSSSPETVIYHLMVARLALMQQIFGKAKQHIERALAIEPTNDDALGLQSQMQHQLGKPASADLFIKLALEQAPQDAEHHLTLANQAFFAGRYEAAAAHYKLVLGTSLHDKNLVERYIDSLLGKFFIYKWLVCKYRAFNLVGFATLIFDLCLILFGVGLISQNKDSAYLPQFKLIVAGLAIYSLSFWVTRLLGHVFMAYRLWGGMGSFLFTAHNFVQLNYILALISLLVYVQTDNFLWFGTAMILAILGFFPLFYDPESEKPTQRFMPHYLILIYVIGACSFALELYGAKKNPFPNLLVAGIFFPIVAITIFDEVKSYLKQRKEPKREPERPSKQYGRAKALLIDWALMPLMFGGMITMKIWAVNFLHFEKFIVIWGGLGVATAAGVHHWMKSRKSALLDFENSMMKAEGMMDAVARILISVFLTVLIMGISLTQLIPISQLPPKKVAMLEHGKNEKNSTAYIYVNHEGTKTKLRPTHEDWEATIGSDSVLLQVHRGLFGVVVVDRVYPVK
ncbi:MAG: tetratricopeptide repeat protein [Saprospiraceae bacterium]|nr:tetratricopeptide repeat protein [Saprospiraceae bacterium]